MSAKAQRHGGGITRDVRRVNQDDYFSLISGGKRGVGAGCLRGGLRVLSWVYAGGVVVRNLGYTCGGRKVHKAGVPVISVGNITAGGTGKTPLVVWVANLLKEKGVLCAILTRGYKAGGGDEPAMLGKACAGAKVVVNPDRVAGAEEAVRRYGAEALVMDDGFQHRRLSRDLDIVTIDATRPFGYGRLLPAGLLREPLGGLARADAVVITRCDQVNEEELSRIEAEVREIKADIVIAKSIHAALGVREAEGKKIGIEELAGKRVFAFCGIGNPEAFLATLRGVKVNIVGSRAFDDHHHYSTSDIDGIIGAAKGVGAELVLTTSKDWTKVEGVRARDAGVRFGYLDVAIRFVGGEEGIRELIAGVLRGRIAGER